MKSRSFQVRVLAALLLLGSSFSVRAADENRPTVLSAYPNGLETSFEWQYSCPSGRGCSFSCPGSGGASNVTKLGIYLGAIPLNGTNRAAGVFYEFSTAQIPRGNGFAITTGLSTLSCQVQGMNLDFSGSKDAPTGSTSTK
jgi:hypothetical protein